MQTKLKNIHCDNEVIEGVLVNGAGDAWIAYEWHKPGLHSLAIPQLQVFQKAVENVLNILPPEYMMVIQDHYTSATYRDTQEEPGSADFLTKASDAHFAGRPYRKHRCYVYFVAPCGSHRRPRSGPGILFEQTLVPQFVHSQKRLVEFRQKAQRLMQGLCEKTGASFRAVTPLEFTGTLNKMGQIERFVQLQPETVPPHLTDIERHEDRLCVGAKTVLLYTVTDAEQLPAQISPAVRNPLLSTESSAYHTGTLMPLGPLLNADHITSLFYVAVDSAKELKKLTRRERQLKSMSGVSRENIVTHDAVTHHLEDVAKGDRRQIRVHLNVIAWTEDPATLPELRNEVGRRFHDVDIIPRLETAGALPVFLASIPGNGGDLHINDTFLTFTDVAACLVIPESSSLPPDPSFGIRLADRTTGIPQLIDLSDQPMKKGWITNRNKMITGPSGSGKTYFILLLILWYFRRGAHLLMIDIGGSYRTLCTLLGGCYFVYTEEHPIELNPFLLSEGETLDTEKKESLKTLLFALYKKPGEPIKQSEYVAVSNLLVEYPEYIKDGIRPCFNSFYESVRDHYLPKMDAEGIREKDFDIQNFLYVLRPYYKGGEYEKLLNAPGEMNLLQERLVVFDIDSIKDHPILFPVVTIVIMDLFISKMRKLKNVRKVIILEEAWKAIAKEGMNDYVKYLFKTVRKFYGEAIVVTQDIEDLISSPVVKNTIINNTDCKILTDHGKFVNRFDEIQQVEGLTEQDKAMVLSLNKANEPGQQYKEVFISLGSNHSRVYRIEVSLEEHLVFTTEETQRVKVDEYAKRHGGLIQGIIALAADIRSGAVKLLVIAAMAAAFLLLPNGRASAQIIDIVDEVVKAALEEADLKIQQLQTQTLLLQNTQKALENSMAGDLLDDITGWVQQQENLFSEYYQELWQVKGAFTTYSKVAQLIDRQAQLVRSYQQATTAVRQDPHFSPAELTHILNVYSGILNESIRNTEQLTLAIKAFVTQMDDASRLRIINETATSIDHNYADLQQFTAENTLLSLQRAKDESDIQTIKTLYGIQ